ncbi:hypothetical protein AAF712_005150 [Marasmius tenuissimus]|uniref:Uncharacterized protein n=1 Tax=Marasmius tenuissimus TaxID=585030 RepID=A0ABR3A1A7_9AGAR
MEVVVHDAQPSKPRVKRKPPPTLSLEERYPPPDPNDPFAPLSVLRNRSSAILGVSAGRDSLSPLTAPGCRASFQLFPAVPLDPESGRDYGTLQDVPPKLQSISVGEGHYKRRSQSMGPNALRYSVKLPPPSLQAPGLFPDLSSDSSGTDIDCESVSDLRTPTSPSLGQRKPRIFTVRKKASQLSINSTFSVASSSSKRPAKSSLSPTSALFSQSITPVSPTSPSIYSRGSLRDADQFPSNTSQESFSFSRDKEADNDYYSQPETERPFVPSSRRLKHSLGSSLTKCTVVPDLNLLPPTPLAPAIPVSIPEAPSGSPSPARSTPSLLSSTSYVEVSAPSFDGHVADNNHPKSPVRPPMDTSASRTSAGHGSLLSLTIPNRRKVSTQPISSVKDPSSPVSESPSSTTALYRFPFRRPSVPTKPTSASKQKPASRTIKISSPTLISPPPSIATRDLSAAPTSSDDITNESAFSSLSQPSVTTDQREITPVVCDTAVPATTAADVQPKVALPTRSRLVRAASLPLITESGVRITFGSIFHKTVTATIVIFIRHFWCPFDQDYIQDVVQVVKYSGDTHTRTRATGNVQLVIIGNGPHTLVAKYRQMMKVPKDVRLFTDPTLQLYETMGMGRVGEACGKVDGTGSSYVKRGLFGGIATMVVRALKVGLPVWEKGGETRQLGGEFVFTDSETCTFAHRMQRKDDHVSISQVFQAVEDSTITEKKSSQEGPAPKASITPESTLSLPDHLSRCAHQQFHIPSSTSSQTHTIRRRTTSLTPTDMKLKAAARKAKVRASSIWSMDVREYGDGDGRVDENETERWKKNLISLRAELAGGGALESSEPGGTAS